MDTPLLPEQKVLAISLLAPQQMHLGKEQVLVSKGVPQGMATSPVLFALYLHRQL